MALTIISHPAVETGAFGKNIIKVETDDPTVKRIKYEMQQGGQTIATQYVPVFAYMGEVTLGDPLGIISTSGLYSSLLPNFTNFIKDHTGSFSQPDMFRHVQTITDKITEDIIGGVSTIITRRVFKATDVKFGTKWTTGTDRYVPYIMDRNGKVMREVFPDQLLPFCYYNNNTATGLYVQITNAGGTSNLGLTNRLQKLRCGVWKVNTIYDHNIISISNGSVALNIYVDRVKYKNPFTLYWLNKFGGWEWFNFIDYTITNKVEKTQAIKYVDHEGTAEVNQMINKANLEMRLYGKNINHENLYYLEDLVQSPIVLDENGERVRLIDNTFQSVGRGLIEPQFTIKYMDSDVIKF